MLARVERILGHGEMLRVGRTNVDRIDGWIAQDLAVVGGNRRDGKARAESSRCVGASARDRRRFDRLNPSHRLEMYAAHKSGAENRCFDLLHRGFSFAPESFSPTLRSNLGPPR